MKKTGMRRRVRVLVPLGAAMLAMAPAIAGAPDPFAALGAERPKEVRAAPEMVLAALDGRVVKLPRDFQGKAVLLSFFTTT